MTVQIDLHRRILLAADVLRACEKIEDARSPSHATPKSVCSFTPKNAPNVIPAKGAFQKGRRHLRTQSRGKNGFRECPTIDELGPVRDFCRLLNILREAPRPFWKAPKAGTLGYVLASDFFTGSEGVEGCGKGEVVSGLSFFTSSKRSEESLPPRVFATKSIGETWPNSMPAEDQRNW